MLMNKIISRDIFFTIQLIEYDEVNYYYQPDIDVYYDVPQGLFVYYDLGRCVMLRLYLPVMAVTIFIIAIKL